MQKIDLHQNVINSFGGNISGFFIQEGNSSNPGGMPEYQKADLQIVFAIIWPYERIAGEDGKEKLVASNDTLVRHWKSYEELRKANDIDLITSSNVLADTKYVDFKLNFVYHLVGADTIKSLEDIEKVYKSGVRSVQLVSGNSNHIASIRGDSDGDGLTNFGIDLVQWMDSNKMIIDTSGMNHQSMVQVYQTTRKPIMNSHANVLSMYRESPNITDEFLDLIARSEGLVGLSLESMLISGDQEATIDDYITQIKYVREKIGDDHIAFGSGYHCMSFGKVIHGFEAIGSLVELEKRLVDEFGYKFTGRFFWENAYRFMMETI